MNGQLNRELEDLIRALGEGDNSARQRAAITLGNIGDPGAVEPLIKALDDEDSFVRDFAARALGSIGDPRAVDPLIRALRDASVLVRRSAAKALESIDNPVAVEPLIQSLDDESVLVRRSAAAALGSVADPRGTEPLVESLGDENIAVRDAAAQALAEIGDAGIPVLVNAIGDWNLGPAIARILESLKWQPSSNEDRVRLNVAQRNGQALLEEWEIARRVLLADAMGGNRRQVENAVYALIGIGQNEVLDDLVGVLRAKGTISMAEAFLNCGNSHLSDAARAWALQHGNGIEGGADRSAIKWGGMKSS